MEVQAVLYIRQQHQLCMTRGVGDHLSQNELCRQPRCLSLSRTLREAAGQKRTEDGESLKQNQVMRKAFTRTHASTHIYTASAREIEIERVRERETVVQGRERGSRPVAFVGRQAFQYLQYYIYLQISVCALCLYVFNALKYSF